MTISEIALILAIPFCIMVLQSFDNISKNLVSLQDERLRMMQQLLIEIKEILIEIQKEKNRWN